MYVCLFACCARERVGTRVTVRTRADTVRIAGAISREMDAWPVDTPSEGGGWFKRTPPSTGVVFSLAHVRTDTRTIASKSYSVDGSSLFLTSTEFSVLQF